MKLELLVIADQRAAVNTFPGLVHTARHTMEVGYTLRQSLYLWLRYDQQLGWSRNKVAVGEPAAGLPPF